MFRARVCVCVCVCAVCEIQMCLMCALYALCVCVCHVYCVNCVYLVYAAPPVHTGVLPISCIIHIQWCLPCSHVYGVYCTLHVNYLPTLPHLNLSYKICLFGVHYYVNCTRLSNHCVPSYSHREIGALFQDGEAILHIFKVLELVHITHLNLS